MVYKNTSTSVKTFYGVTFNPNEAHIVPGYINDPCMVRLSKMPKSASKPSKKLDEKNNVVKEEKADGTDNNK